MAHGCFTAAFRLSLVVVSGVSSLVAVSGVSSLVAVRGLLIAVASLVAGHGR